MQADTHLESIHTDDAVAVACAVIKIGDGDSLLAGGDPVLLGSWVDLEHMRPGGVNRLLPEKQRTGVRDYIHERMTTLTEPR